MLAEKMRHDDAYERAMNEWLQRPALFASNGTAYPTQEQVYGERLDGLR